jgi:hypothetical protein
MNSPQQAFAFLRWSGRAAGLLLALAVVLTSTAGTPVARGQQAIPAVTGVPDPVVRFVHGSPDAPAVTVLIDEQPLAEGVAFGTATEYLPTTPGDHRVQVVPAEGGEPVSDQTVTFDGWTSTILAAVGDLANLQLQATTVDVTETEPGQARVRVVNAIPNGPGLTVANAGGDWTMADGIAFPEASAYQVVNAGAYDLQIRNSDSGETLVSVPGLQLAEGQVYDLYAVGQAADQNLQLLPLATPVATPCGETLGIGETSDVCLRMVHAAPDAGPVDVYLGEAAIAEGMEFGAVSAFAAAPNGQQQLRLVPAAQALDQAKVDTTQDFSAGGAFQITATGLADDLQATIAGVDLRALPENQARVRVVHASPDLDAIDVAIAGGPTPFDAVGYRSQSGYVVFNAGTYSFQLREDGSDTLLLEALDVQIEPGMVYDILAIGQSEVGTLQMVIITAPAATLASEDATPIAGTPAAQATPAATITPVVAVGSTPVMETPGAATPAS